MASTTSGGYLLIDAATGWRATEVVDLVAPNTATGPDPAPLGLETLPGGAAKVFADNALAPDFPAAVVGGARGRVGDDGADGAGGPGGLRVRNGHRHKEKHKPQPACATGFLRHSVPRNDNRRDASR